MMSGEGGWWASKAEAGAEVDGVELLCELGAEAIVVGLNQQLRRYRKRAVTGNANEYEGG